MFFPSDSRQSHNQIPVESPASLRDSRLVRFRIGAVSTFFLNAGTTSFAVGGRLKFVPLHVGAVSRSVPWYHFTLHWDKLVSLRFGTVSGWHYNHSILVPLRIWYRFTSVLLHVWYRFAFVPLRVCTVSRWYRFEYVPFRGCTALRW